MGKNFREQIKEELKSCSHKDICFFAWLCAVNALPFLGAEGNFDYWKEIKKKDMRQNHLLSVLKAIDLNIYTIFTTTYAYYDANAVYANAYAAADAIAYTYDAATKAAAAIAHAAYTNIANTPNYNLYTAANDIAHASYAATAATIAADRYKINLKPFFLKDLKQIKSRKNDFKRNTSLYGKVWINFQRSLRDLDCGYWGQWYEKLFAKGFILNDDDKAEIKTRLNVPKEISEQGTAEASRYIMDLKENGAERLNETRVLILGEKGSGKTSLTWRLMNPECEMPNDNDSTEGVDVVDIMDWTISGAIDDTENKVNVHIWDFAGDVITHAVHRCFMSERCLYILLIDGRTEGGNRNEYWLEQIHNYSGNSPLLVVINTRDNKRVDIPENTLMKTFPSILGFSQINIKKGGTPLEVFRKLVMGYLRDNPVWKYQKISSPAYKVKESLLTHFIEGKEYITRDEFDRIAEEHGIAWNEHKQLLKDLHALGICLWYDENEMAEFNTMVLNPSWISHGIYRMINWGLTNKKHILSVSDFRKMFSGNELCKYPGKKAGFLFKLMNIYQLAFFKDPNQILIPLLLRADRPDLKLIPDFPFGERLRMEYKANQSLPPYTVSRLAVLHFKDFNEHKSWRFGALLQRRNTTALVEEDERTCSVMVSVKGPLKTEYISELRDTLDRIFSEYKSSRPELKYEVLLPDELMHCADNGLSHSDLLSLLDNNEFLQPANQIIGHAKAGQKLVTSNPNFPPIDPNQTLQYYNINIYGNIVVSNKLNFQFNNCSVALQNELNSLAQNLQENGALEDTKELVKELENTASNLDEAGKLIPANAQEDSKEMKEAGNTLEKKGLLKRLKYIYDNLCDENSELYKKTKKLRKGAEMLYNLGSYYNNVAKWFQPYLPQISEPILKMLKPNKTT